MADNRWDSKGTALVLLAGALLCARATALAADSIGLSPAEMARVHVVQRDSMWCWAASVEMLFKAYGLQVGQQHIVRRLYGDSLGGQVRNHGGSVQDVTRALQGGDVDEQGRRYWAMGQFHQGAPTARILQWELAAKHPILVICSLDAGNEWRHITHAMVMVGGDTGAGPDGDSMFQRLTVLDPASRDAVSLPATPLLRRILCYWTVKVQFQ